MGPYVDRPIQGIFANAHPSIAIDARTILFGDICNLRKLRDRIRHPVLEWSDVKTITSIADVQIDFGPTDPVEQLGCCRKRSEDRPFLYPGPIFNQSDENEIFVTFPALASLVYAKHPHPSFLDGSPFVESLGDISMPSLTKLQIITHYKSITVWDFNHQDLRNLTHLTLMHQGPLMRAPRLVSELRPEEQLACFDWDFLYYASSGVQRYEFENRWPPAWNTVGTHLHFTQPLVDLTDGYLRRAMNIGEAEDLPPMISPAKRHQGQLHRRQGTAVFHSAIKDLSFWEEISSFGWNFFNHTAERTVERFSKWHPLLIDKVALSQGIGFIGTNPSTFSILNAFRIEDWNDGVTKMSRNDFSRGDIPALSYRKGSALLVYFCRVIEFRSPRDSPEATLLSRYVGNEQHDGLLFLYIFWGAVECDLLVGFSRDPQPLASHSPPHPQTHNSIVTNGRISGAGPVTSIIFSNLKEMALGDSGSEEGLYPPQKIPAPWKRTFARLARTNRTMFHASIDVLWETMTSLEPFFGTLLLADLDEKGGFVGPLLIRVIRQTYNCEQPTEKDWERFKLYSGRTKVLVLDELPQPSGVSPEWLTYLVTSKHMPNPLFPAVKRLFLSSTDNLSLYVASCVAPSLQAIRLSLGNTPEAKVACHALAASISQNARALTEFRFMSPIEPKSLKHILNMRTITYLRIQIHAWVDKFPTLSALNGLLSLRQLVIAENWGWPITESWITETRNGPYHLPSLDIEGPIARESPLKHLESIEVCGGVVFQFQLASAVSPRSLKELRLLFMEDESDEGMCLVPLVLAIYASRNTDLQVLRASGICPYEYRGAEGTRALLAAVGGLHALRTLHLEIPFFSPSILEELLLIAQQLPELEFLLLQPPMLTSGGLVLPHLNTLEGIAKSNPRLRVLETQFDFSHMHENHPIDCYSNHNLEKMVIHLEEGHFDEFYLPNEQQFAKYLDRLFPRLKVVEELIGARTGQKGGPGNVQKYLRFFQDARARMARESSRYVA
ncbi:hypothetical protein DFP72DRAFT_1152908 [Ephemerocybe angulata]|uniref:Uncharacterized protein n=1 Tax=Ephemerocybe angulata TaxID=980116 RepID=A0A8H6HGY1_9AGAR|nr:hypothetical protein DFP72DRAFT_1152908 [Tulosesus angulatus]